MPPYADGHPSSGWPAGLCQHAWPACPPAWLTATCVTHLPLPAACHLPLCPPPATSLSARRLPQVFGATDDDMAKVRIVGLLELDMDKLDRMASGQEDGSSSTQVDRKQA